MLMLLFALQVLSALKGLGDIRKMQLHISIRNVEFIIWILSSKILHTKS